MAITEPLLIENPNRFVLFPIKYPDIQAFYKTAVGCFWTPEELKNLNEDAVEWGTLTDNERSYIRQILAFFAASDGIVNENLAERFYNEIQIPEARNFYGFQIAMENIHSETYSLLIDTYIKDPVLKESTLNAIQTIPIVKKKAEWALRWIESSKSFATRLIAFAIVEGVFFSGSFCSIFWLKSKQKMKGLCFSNELISRDEGLHRDFAVHLYVNYVEGKLSQEEIYEIFRDAVAIEKEFCTDAIPCAMLGMNADLMVKYIEFVADELLMDLGYAKLWGSENPFEFMKQQGNVIKPNFFEVGISSYKKAGVGTSSTTIDDGFKIADEF